MAAVENVSSLTKEKVPISFVAIADSVLWILVNTRTITSILSLVPLIMFVLTKRLDILAYIPY